MSTSSSSSSSSSTMNVVVQTQQLPPVIYIRTQDSETLFAIHSHVFTQSGTIPDHSLLRYAFNGATKQQQPMYYHHDIPVYFISLPSKVFQHMLTGFNMPHTWSLLDASLPKDIPKKVWRQYLDFYGLTFAPTAQSGSITFDGETGVDGNDDGEDVASYSDDDNDNEILKASRLAKEKEKKPTLTPKEQFFKDTQKWLAKRKDKLAWRFCERVARALAQYIQNNHPEWKRLIAGQSMHIDCHLVSSEEESSDGDHTLLLSISGDPPVNPVRVVDLIVYEYDRLSSSIPSEKPSWKYFKACMADEWKCEQRVRFLTVDMDSHTRRKYPLPKTYWPVQDVLLSPREHDVVHIRVENVVN